MLTSHWVTGGGGARLHVEEAGHVRGRPILFIHGISQCGLAWRRQLGSKLAERFRLLALDMRGHGLSDKPDEGYTDGRLWADDVHAVVRELDLDRPILCGWSYGALVILDYLRHYGDDDIGALHLVDAITKLGSEEAMSVLTPELLALVPDLFATDAEANVRGLGSLLRLCFARELPVEDFYLMLGYNLIVPPPVRQAMFSRRLDNDDLLSEIRVPVLISHGEEDAVVRTLAAERHKAAIPHSRLQFIAGAGHAPFRDDAGAFNRALRSFAEQL